MSGCGCLWLVSALLLELVGAGTMIYYYLIK